MKFFDSHCHLHDLRISRRLAGMIDRARDAGVACMATCATKESNFERTAQLSFENNAILPCFGIHPWFIDSRSDQWVEVLEKALLTMPSAVGETGLDFVDRPMNRDLQVEVFKIHLDLARQLKRPVNIHIRKAWDTFIHILKEFGPLDVPGVIHSYSGSADMIPVFEKHNLYISFSGSITNRASKKVAAALEMVSRDRVVLETDSPDIYPRIPNPDPSGLNEPANLPAIARIAAERIGAACEAFCDRAYKNSLKLFESIHKQRK